MHPYKLVDGLACEFLHIFYFFFNGTLENIFKKKWFVYICSPKVLYDANKPSECLIVDI